MRLVPVLMALAVCAALVFWIAPGMFEGGAGASSERAPAAATAETPQDADRKTGESAAPKPKATPVKVAAFASQAQPVSRAVVLRGRTEAHRLVDVKAETDGLVISDPLRAGAKVAKGDLLCRLDSGAREAQLAEMEARLAQAEADADAANRLADRGLAAKNTAKARSAELSAAQSALRSIRQDIERLELRAPFAGVLESDSAELGALMRKGDVCARVIALDPIKIVGWVPEAEVDAIEVGMPAGARLVSGREIAGEVIFVSRSAEDATRTFRVEIQAPNENGTIRDGLTAEIAVPVAAVSAHMAPQSALTLDDRGRMGVRVVEDGPDGPVARFHPVEILREEMGGLWITGLPETAEIIHVGQDYVSDGRRVAPTLTHWRPDGEGDGNQLGGQLDGRLADPGGDAPK